MKNLGIGLLSLLLTSNVFAAKKTSSEEMLEQFNMSASYVELSSLDTATTTKSYFASGIDQKGQTCNLSVSLELFSKNSDKNNIHYTLIDSDNLYSQEAFLSVTSRVDTENFYAGLELSKYKYKHSTSHNEGEKSLEITNVRKMTKYNDDFIISIPVDKRVAEEQIIFVRGEGKNKDKVHVGIVKKGLIQKVCIFNAGTAFQK